MRSIATIDAAGNTQPTLWPDETTLARCAPYGLAVLRIVAAVLFIEAGIQILFAIPAPVMPIPPDMITIVTVAGVLELAGGLFILAGYQTRLAAFILSGEMAVGYWMVHAPVSLFPTNNMGTAAILFCFVFLYLVFAGPGAWSLDNRDRDDAQGRRTGVRS